MECIECLYFDSIAEHCVLHGNCAYEDTEELDYEPSQDDCDNCFFRINDHCEKIGGCRFS